MKWRVDVGPLGLWVWFGSHISALVAMMRTVSALALVLAEAKADAEAYRFLLVG
jgi:hypothetical protein